MTELHLTKMRHGYMCYFPHDYYIGGSLGAYGEYSELETELMVQLLQPGDTVIDVGANIGCLTLPLAQRVGEAGRVFAFEPQRVIFQMLCANMALNGLRNVFTHQCALGYVPGEIGVPPVNYDELANFGDVAMVDKSSEMVPVHLLDDFDLASCHLIKIDVQGMEKAVLMGAEETIKRCQPMLYVENDMIEHSRELVSHIMALDYDLYWHLPPLYNANNFKAEKTNHFEGIASINMLCVPKSRNLDIAGLRPIKDPAIDWKQEWR